MQKVCTKIKKNKTKILGVTILTSLNGYQTKKYYNNQNVNELVKKFALNAKKNNLDGIVCSPLEITTVRKEVGNKMKNKLYWKPKINFNNGIENTINWYISNAEWLIYCSKKYKGQRLGLND